MKNALIVLMLIGISASAQFEEIDYQEVALGNYIRQLAIVENITDTGAKFRELCPDCSCTITMTDSKNVKVVDHGVCEQIGPGTFGYIASLTELKAGENYVTVHDCFSPTRGSGYALSQVNVLSSSVIASPPAGEDTPVLVPPAGSCGASVTCYLSRATDALGNIVSAIASLPGKLYDAVYDAIDGITSTGKDIVDTIKSSGILELINMVLSYVKWSTGSMIKLFTHPELWLEEDFIPTLLSVLTGILILFFIPVVLVEFFIIGWSMTGGTGDLFGWISRIIDGHIRVAGVLWYAAISGLGIFTALFRAGIAALSFVRQIFQI